MWRQLTMQRLTAAILFILLFAMATRPPVDTDTWWHLRSGEHQITNLTVVKSDLFSHTKVGTPWTNHSWGSQNVMVLIYRGFGGHGEPGDGGNIGLALWTALMATLGMYFVYRTCAGSVYIRAFAVVLGAATAALFWSPRPQMFTFLFSTIVFYLLYSYKWQQVDRLWLIPVVMLFWGNMHAGFAIAFILMAGFIVGETVAHLFGPPTTARLPWRGIRRILIIMGISVLALVINPFGLEMLKVPFATLNIGVLQDFIQEWAAPNFHQRQTWPFIFLLLGSLGFAALSSERIDWTDLALVTGTGFLALLSARNIALFAVVAPPVLARHVDVFLKDRNWNLQPSTRVSPTMARINWIILILIGLVAAGKVVNDLNPAQIRDAQITSLPVEVSAHINEARPDGLMFNSYNWGGYLMFASPDNPVYVDGRTDLYGDEFLSEYLRVIFLQEDYGPVFDKWAVDWVVIEAQGMLAATLRADSDWQLTYEDDLAVLFERKTIHEN
ncbi:hypothetical protein ACFLYO_05650 [Chloroflexota bacterium]